MSVSLGSAPQSELRSDRSAVRRLRVATADIPTVEEKPIPFTPVSCPIVAAPKACSLYSHEEALAAQEWRGEPIGGLVTINVFQQWMPLSCKSVPPSMCAGMGMELAAQWIVLFNESAFAIRKRRFAVLTNRGGVLVLSDIPDEERPENPGAFPSCVLDGLTVEEADELAVKTNRERHTIGGVIRRWNVPLRSVNSVLSLMKGGETL